MIYDTMSEWVLRGRGGVLIALSVLIGSLTPTTAFATHSGPAAEQAARQILEAQERANQVADELFDTESELDVLAKEIGRTERRLASIETEVAEMRSSLEVMAITRFVGSAQANEFMLLSDAESVTDVVTAGVFNAIAHGAGAVEVDDLDALVDEAESTRVELQHQRADSENAQARFEALK
jgi:septal ring factor EnvC (AmiA/AmiB activator)